MRRLYIRVNDSTLRRLAAVAEQQGCDPRHLASHILDVVLARVDMPAPGTTGPPFGSLLINDNARAEVCETQSASVVGTHN